MRLNLLRNIALIGVLVVVAFLLSTNVVAQAAQSLVCAAMTPAERANEASCRRQNPPSAPKAKTKSNRPIISQPAVRPGSSPPQAAKAKAKTPRPKIIATRNLTPKQPTQVQSGAQPYTAPTSTPSAANGSDFLYDPTASSDVLWWRQNVLTKQGNPEQLGEYSKLYLQSFPNGTHRIEALKYIADASRTPTGGFSGNLIKKELIGNSGAVNAIAITKDSRFVITASRDGSLLVWNSDTGRRVKEIPNPMGAIGQLIISKDGRYMAASSGISLATKTGPEVAKTGPDLVIWETSDYQLIKSVSEVGPITGLSFSPSHKYIAITIHGEGIKLLNWENLADTKSLIEIPKVDTSNNNFNWAAYNAYKVALGNQNDFRHGVFNSDGSSIAFGRGGRLQTINITTARITGNYSTGFETISEIDNVSYSNDGNLIAVSNRGGIHLISTATLRPKCKYGSDYSNGKINDARFDPSWEIIATANSDNTASIIRTSDCAEINRLEGHTAPLETLAFAPNGTFLVTGSQDEKAIIWRKKN